MKAARIFPMAAKFIRLKRCSGNRVHVNFCRISLLITINMSIKLNYELCCDGFNYFILICKYLNLDFSWKSIKLKK